MKLILQLLLIVAVLAGLTWDNTVHENATWVSHVLFWPALAYVVFVVVQAFRKPNLNNRKGQPLITLAVLLLAGTASACQRPALAVAEKAQADHMLASAEESAYWPPVQFVTDSAGWTYSTKALAAR